MAFVYAQGEFSDHIDRIIISMIYGTAVRIFEDQLPHSVGYHMNRAGYWDILRTHPGLNAFTGDQFKQR
jgi:hypothetical protein